MGNGHENSCSQQPTTQESDIHVSVVEVSCTDDRNGISTVVNTTGSTINRPNNPNVNDLAIAEASSCATGTSLNRGP